jgi:2-methylaconitate cis-trans-isomerase PrpF
MGGGVSSLSKVCVIEKSKREDADVDYTFVQVGIKDGGMDMAGNCGNMSSAVGPFAINEGLIDERSGKIDGDGMTMVRIFNTNTKKIIHSTFATGGSPSAFEPKGDYSIDGVPGTSSKISLSFLRPGGAKAGKTLPTGNAVDVLYCSHGQLPGSLVDVANPGVFVKATDLDVEKDTTPDRLGADTDMMSTLEELRQEGAKKMGLDPAVGSVPKILLLFPPDEADEASGIDIRCQALSMGQAHKAVPLTLALNLGVACNLEGTIPWQLKGTRSKEKHGSVVVGHPSGKLEVGAKMVSGEAESAILLRTARLLMKGEVNCF